jgi:adenosylcobinamide-GDP ribazoletransferase
MMRSLLGGLVTAFSMYSWIPMPQLEWRKDTMKYALCFFPLVGAVSGGCVALWAWVSSLLGLQTVLFAALAVLLPVFLTGGIHLDGFIDTCDALYSRQPMEKKLEILKDPHVGAFGVISCGCYLLLAFALACQIGPDLRLFLGIGLGSVLSRSMSAFSIVTLKTAKNSGLAYLFADNADKKAVRISSLVVGGIALALIFVVSLWLGLVALVVTGIVYLIFLRICRKQIGGITGDLAGFMLELVEMGMLLAAVVVGVVRG